MNVKYADVEEQYKKNKKLKKEDVAMMREWLQTQPHLPKITELETITFLHSCYYSNEATKKCIDNYYTIRTLCPEFFINRNPTSKEQQHTLKTFAALPLPKLTPEGYCIFFNKVIDMNPDVYNMNQIMKLFDMTASLYLQEMGALEGHIIIIDLKDATLTHLLYSKVLSVKKFLIYLQEALPFRLKGFHFTNAVYFMDKVLALVKPFMKKELVDLLQVHQQNSDTIFKSIPKDCLPIEIGGTLGSYLDLHEKHSEKIRLNADYFCEEEKRVVTESLRPGKPKTAGELFGVEGTFKKLDID